MTLTFERATKHEARARIALVGPSGSGKTYTALVFAAELGQPVALVDTERRSASKYADLFTFDALNLDTFAPASYIAAIDAAAAAGYPVLVIDSLSHAWMGRGGLLEQVDNYGRAHGGNSFAGWRDATPQHNALVDAILTYPGHVIVTMRVKTEYVVERDDRGKSVPRKVGLAPVQRDGLEYEFDVVADLTLENDLIVSKTRCSALRGLVVREPGPEVAKQIKDWLGSGAPLPTVDELRGKALAAWDDVDALRALLAEVDFHGLRNAPCLDADDQPTTLGALIANRGRYLTAAPAAPAAEDSPPPSDEALDAEAKTIRDLACDPETPVEQLAGLMVRASKAKVMDRPVTGFAGGDFPLREVLDERIKARQRRPDGDES